MLVRSILFLLLGLLALPASGQVYEPPTCAGDGDFPTDSVSLAVAVAPAPIALGDSVRVTYSLRNDGRSAVAGCLSDDPEARFSFSGAGSDLSEERFSDPTHPTCDPFVLPPGSALTWAHSSLFDGYPLGRGTFVGVIVPDAACPWRGEVRSAPLLVEVVGG